MIYSNNMIKLTELIKILLRLLLHLDLQKLYPVITGVLLTTFLITLSGGCSSANSPVPGENMTEDSVVDLKPPEVIIFKIDNMALALDSLTLALQATVLNPNAESITLDDIRVSAQDSAGLNCVQETIPGGLLEPASVKVFGFDVSLPGKFLTLRKLTVNLDLKISNNEALPSVSSAIDLDIPDILNRLIINPEIVVQANVTRLLRDGLNNRIEAQVEGSISNPNPISLDFNVIRLLIKDNNGTVIIAEDLPDTIIAPEAESAFQKIVTLPVQVMNGGSLTADVETTVRIPNYSKSFKEAAEIQMPELNELISVPQITIDTNATGAKWIRTSTSPFLEMTVANIINNSNDLDLTTGDLKINIYCPGETLIKSVEIGADAIQGLPRISTRTITNTFDIKSDFVGITSKNACVTVTIDVGVPGINEKIPLKASTMLELKPQSWPEY